MQSIKHLNRFLKTGLFEGISFIVLVAIAMPLKYMADMPLPVRIVGMLHGILFILYCILLVQCTLFYKWRLTKTIIAFLLSFVPCGTFFLGTLLKEEIQSIPKNN